MVGKGWGVVLAVVPEGQGPSYVMAITSNHQRELPATRRKSAPGMCDALLGRFHAQVKAAQGLRLSIVWLLPQQCRRRARALLHERRHAIKEQSRLMCRRTSSNRS
jgi:hypothetical protein